MRKAFFDAGAKFEPYSALYEAGATPTQVKEAIVALLRQYVRDEKTLTDLAVGLLAVDAVTVGQLSSRQDWKALLDLCFDIREKAILGDAQRAFEVLAHFEPAIREAQKNYALLVVFETDKQRLNLDEFSFELFRCIGSLIESNIQPYLKELYCLQILTLGRVPDVATVASDDFGRVCYQLEQTLPGPSLLVPAPWGLRVNQWRNIAQHHSYSVRGDRIVASYGRTQPPKQVSLSRGEMLVLAQELVRRLGALKSSRTLTCVNHMEELETYLPLIQPHEYNHAAALTASFATQGFRLQSLQVQDGQATAVIEDVAPTEGNVRPIHCSQFVAAIADHFPDVAVRVQYVAHGYHSWTFEATAEELRRVMALENPLSELAHVVVLRKEP